MTNPNQEPKLHKMFVEDFRRGDLKRTIQRDFRDLKEFMLNEERRLKLQQLGRFRRWFYMSWWFLKTLFFKLTPARRFLVALSLVLFFMQDNFNVSSSGFRVNFNFGPLSGLLLLFVLMLELKDKLLAHEELEAGQAVQQALMPPRSPDVPGWRIWLFTRSANEVGGDLVDFIKISPKRFAVAVGDVAGKGLRAALLTAKLQATLRALAPDFTSLPLLGAKLNEIFNRDSLPTLFASLLYFEFEENGSLRFVNAGHLPPVLLKGQEIKKFEKGGVALGLVPAATFDEKSLKIQHNELLLAYSDGITDAQNAVGEFFGENRLFDLLPKLTNLSTDQIGETIIKELDMFIGEARATDDVTIAILRRV